MKYFKFLHIFSEFKQLKENGTFICPLSGIKITMEENLFGFHTFYIDNLEYVILDNEDEDLVEKVIIPLCKALEPSERLYLFQEEPELDKVREYQSFKSFLSNGEFHSDLSNNWLELHPLFSYNGTNYTVHEVEELYEDYEPEEDDGISLFYEIESDNICDYLENWVDDNKLRLKILTGVIRNPNKSLCEELYNFFSSEECFQVANRHYIVNKHYSDYEKFQIGFNIKVYDDFIHNGLLELKLLSWEDESQNRSDAIRKCVDWIVSEGFDINDWSIDGRGGGYLVIEFEEGVTPDRMSYLCDEMAKRKETAASVYQSLSYYWDTSDEEMEIQLKHMLEEDPDNSDIILPILSEISEIKQELSS